MEQSVNESSQWEQSKENIQPLKQGRSATVLSVVLSDNAAQKLNIIRHEFEEKLRTYSGDDPLEVWYEYVLWVEQNYPKGGKEGKLTKLIEKCLMAMYSSADLREKYVNDQRFLDIWIKYANLSPNSLEIYQTMEAKGLCLSLAGFYISWAWEMEQTGNFKKTEAIYEKGLQVGAKPLSSLHESQKKFQIRTARSTIEGRLTDQEVNNTEQGRVALGTLKSQGQRIPVNRNGQSLIGPAGRFHQDFASKENGGPAFSILKDTSSKGVISSAPPEEKQRGALGIGHSSNRENTRKPSQWTKAKVHQKAKDIVPVEDIDKYQIPKFSVHEDENASQKGGNQARVAHTSNVLSVHKEEYDSWDVQLFIPEPFDPKVQPQYCKHKVYCGTEEFSFEELRAAQFAKKEREKKEKEDELQQMREMLKKQEELIQKLLHEKVEEKQNHSSRIEAPPKLQTTSQKKELKSGSVIYQDSWLSINKSVNASTSVLQLLDENEQPPNIGCSRELSVSNNKSPAVTLGSGFQEVGNLSASGNSRGLSLTDPTGDATNIMNDIFSASLSHSASQPMTDRVEISEGTSNGAPAFSIHEDDTKKQQLGGGNIGTPFPIFSDPASPKKKMETLGISQPTRVLKEKAVTEVAPAEVEPTPSPEILVSTVDDIEKYPENQDENCPPAGLVQQPCETRHISGILVPAKDIPLPKDQENQETSKTSNKINWDDNDVSALKNEDLDDFVPLDGRHLEDFTIKMPNNIETFAHMAKVASTPVPWAVEPVAKSPSTKDTYSIAIGTLNNHYPLIGDEEGSSESPKKYGSNVELMPPPSTTKAHSTTLSSATSQYLHEPEAALSPIMEASREFRSSSSSSGCNTTPRGHSVHGISQPGIFSLSSTTHMSRIRHHSHPDPELVAEPLPPIQPGDFTKSGYLADRSRGESLADSLPYTSGAAHPLSKGHAGQFSGLAAEMVWDLKDMILPSGDAEDQKSESSHVQEKKSEFPRNINPFDENIIEHILSRLELPLKKRGGYVAITGSMPYLKAKMQVTLGKEIFHIYKVCGEGAYAKAYRAITMDPLNVTLMSHDTEEDNEQQVILKVQKPACPWEFYICHELRQRLKASGCSQIFMDAVMKVDRGYFFSNGSVLANQYHKYGTLLDAINRYVGVGQTFPEDLAMYFMVEILSILEAVHSCNIIHADIKPDNFLVQAINIECDTSIFSRGPVYLKLIDFGRSIDMNAFPEGTTFTETVTTDKFTCCEMMEKRPWTFQIDYFGAAAIAHLFLFGSYMDVKKTTAGQWTIKGAFKRYWKKDLWEMLFSTLLNVPSCSSLLNLSHLKQEIITTFHKAGMHKDINGKLQEFSTQITQL